MPEEVNGSHDRVEDFWLATTCQRHLQCIEAELRVKAARELSAEHVS